MFTCKCTRNSNPHFGVKPPTIATTRQRISRPDNYVSQHTYSSYMATEIMTSPNLLQSPYRLPPIPKSASGNDLVSGIVDKFNSLTVVDKDEQRDFYEKQVLKLRSALDRAEVAREEAETQAKKLRDKLLDLQDERQKEKSALKERASEFEVS